MSTLTSKLPSRQLVEAGALVLRMRPDSESGCDDSLYASGSRDMEIALHTAMSMFGVVTLTTHMAVIAGTLLKAEADTGDIPQPQAV